MRNKWFQKLMFSYLPLFFIMISILVFIFFLAVNQIAEKENQRANQQFAKHILQLLDNEMYTLKQEFLNDIYFADEVQLFFNPLYKEDIELNYRLIQRLQNFVSSNEFIDSIYLYRESDHSVLSDTIMVDAELYADMDFVLNGNVTRDWSDARLFAEVGDPRERRVISSKMSYPLANTPRGWLVVNVNISALNHLFNELGRVDLSYVYIKDQAKHWLMGNLTQQEAEQQAKDVILHSEITGWTLYSGLKEHYLFNSLQLISRIWIISGILIILAGFIWLIYLIRRNYKPVEALAARIEGFSLRKSMELRGNYDEFKFIEHTLDTLLEDAQSHSKQLKESQLYKEKFLFQGLIEGTQTSDSKELQQVLIVKGFGVADSGYKFILIEMDRFRDFEASFTRRDQMLLKFALMSVIKEIADKHHLSLWADWVSDKQVGVLVQGVPAREQVTPLRTLFEECLRWVEANLSFTITIAEGLYVEQIDEVYLSYDHTLELIRFKPTIGNNRWLEQSQLEQITGVGYYQLIPKAHALTEEFRVGKLSWLEHLDSMYENIQDHHMSRNEIVNLFEYLLHKLNSELSEVVDVAGTFWNGQRIEEIQQVIENFDTVEELFIDIKTPLTVVFERMLEWRKDNSNHTLLDKAKLFIEDNYTDADLSLNQISDLFGMNPAHFSRTFKMGTGEKFVDYVTRIRMEHAKRRLIESDTSIQDIGFEVGYVHAVSFNRAFKKAAGVTPGDYRKQQLN